MKICVVRQSHRPVLFTELGFAVMPGAAIVEHLDDWTAVLQASF